MTGGPLGPDRLSLNQATVKHLDLAQSVDLCVRHEIPAIGLWRDRVAEAGLRRAAATVRDAGLHVSSLCRGGFFTHPEGRPGPVPWRTTARPSPRRPSWGRTPSSWSRAGCRPAAGIWPWPGAWSPMRSPTWSPPRSGWEYGWASSPCIRCSAPTAVSCPPWATRLTWPSSSRPRRSEWSWTPTTSGGTRSWPRRSTGPAAASSASSCATGWCRCPRTRCWAAAISATA